MRVPKRSVTLILSFIAFFSHNTQRYSRLYQQHRSNQSYCNPQPSFLINTGLHIVVGACLQVSQRFGHRAPPHQYLHRPKQHRGSSDLHLRHHDLQEERPDFPSPMVAHKRPASSQLPWQPTSSDVSHVLRSLIPATVASTLANHKKDQEQAISSRGHHATSVVLPRTTRSLARRAAE